MAPTGSDAPGPLEPRIIREQLAALLNSPQFARSQKLQRFLEFVVDRKLAGREDEIQEYAIGLEVFGRRESFDPRSDSIVRVEARRLRDRLADYYAQEGSHAPVRITLPQRGYIPCFEPHNSGASWRAPAVAAAVACLLVTVGLYSALRSPPSRPEPPAAARDAFEKGLVAWRQWTAEGARKAEQFFQQAIAYDPEYARAYAWLSAAYRQQATMGDADPREVFTKSLEAAEKAISLDPKLADGYHSLATNLTIKLDWSGAESAYRTAIRLEPDNAEIHHAFGIVLLAASPERLAEAEVELRRAVRLKPGDLTNRVVLAKIVYFRRRFQEARSILQEILDIDATYPDAMRNLASVLVQTRDYDGAIRLFENAQKFAYLEWGDGLLGHALAVSGDRKRAQTILTGLESRYAAKPVGALAIGTIYVGLQKWVPACEWLDKARASQDMRARYLNVDPIYAPIRQQPCFADLLERAKFSEIAHPRR